MTTEVRAGEAMGWKSFMRKHSSVVVIFAISVGLVIAAAVYVFWWFVGIAQSSGLVPSSLGLWTTNNLITFILNGIFWELLLIGIPVIIGAIIVWQWLRRLSD